MTRKRWRPSLMVSDEVGSSRMRSLSSCDRPLAISTICCWPGERVPTGARIDVDLEVGQDLARPLDHRAPPDDAERVGGLAAGIDVLGDAQRAHEAALLEDHGDAGVGGALLVEADDRRAVELDRAAVGLVDARHEVHERRLAGAVLADQRVDLAGADLERDVVDRADAGERLGHAPHHEHGAGRVVFRGRGLGRGKRLPVQAHRLPPGPEAPRLARCSIILSSRLRTAAGSSDACTYVGSVVAMAPIVCVSCLAMLPARGSRVGLRGRASPRRTMLGPNGACQVIATVIHDHAVARSAIAQGRMPGNLRFDILQSVDDPTRFAARAHRETAHYLAFRDTVAQWMVEPRHSAPYERLLPAGG